MIAQQLKKYIVDSQIFVATTATAFCLFFMLEQKHFNLIDLFIVFITYLSGYLYTKYHNVNKFKQSIFVFNVICLLGCSLIFYIEKDLSAFLKWLLILILGMLYNSDFLKISARKIPLFKIFYVALVWGLINAWFIIPQFNMLVLAINFLFVSALIMAFDIRDVDSDTVLTFPQYIGLKNTKYLAVGFMIVAIILAYFGLKFSFFITFSITTLLSIILILGAKNSFPDWYFSFVLEGCSALPLIIQLIPILV